MGGTLSYFFGCYDFLNSTKKNVIICGVEGSGKRTIEYKLKIGEIATTSPTKYVGGRSGESKDKIINITFLKDKLTPQNYKNICPTLDGLIFVVDSSDLEKFKESKEEFERFTDNYLSKQCKILIYANKYDLEVKINEQELVEKFQLEKVKQDWYIQRSNALIGDGLYEGLDWFTKKLYE